MFPPGINGHVSQCTYSMTYPPLFNTVQYNEPFAILTCSSEYVQAAGAALDAAAESLVAALAEMPEIAAAVQAIYSLGSYWIQHACLNADGSLTLEFAYHYCGTPGGGVDLVYASFGAVSAASYQGFVNSLINGLRGYRGLDALAFDDFKVVTTSNNPAPEVSHAR